MYTYDVRSWAWNIWRKKKKETNHERKMQWEKELRVQIRTANGMQFDRSYVYKCIYIYKGSVSYAYIAWRRDEEKTWHSFDNLKLILYHA